MLNKVKRPKPKGKGKGYRCLSALLLIGCTGDLTPQTVIAESNEYLASLCAQLDKLPNVADVEVAEKIAKAQKLCKDLLATASELTPELQKLADQLIPAS